MKISIGTDPYGVELKDVLKTPLLAAGHPGVDLGGSSDQPQPYYAVAHARATQVAQGEFERGILICGTGMGMAIMANKPPGVYAGVCEEPSTAVKARSINNANVLTLGACSPPRLRPKRLRTHFWGLNLRRAGSPRFKRFWNHPCVTSASLRQRHSGTAGDETRHGG